jgi:hypothetical protein
LGLQAARHSEHGTLIQHEFKYDVAFSFLARDESITQELNDLIQDRVATFVYSERQEAIAGTDGEETFNKVFGEDARIVVILYRDGWGETPWTRIEETAIRNRGFKENYDFLVFIPLDKEATIPRWLPRAYLWVGFDRWGATGAASVIEARVQQAGGSPRTESVADRAVRLKRQMDQETARRRFLDSIEGVRAALEESRALHTLLEDKAEQIRVESDFTLSTERTREGMDVCASYGCLKVDWSPKFANSLDSSSLDVSLWGGKPPRPGRMFIKTPPCLKNQKYHFDRTHSGEVGWRDSSTEEFFSSDRLADALLQTLLDHAHEQHITRER